MKQVKHLLISVLATALVLLNGPIIAQPISIANDPDNAGGFILTEAMMDKRFYEITCQAPIILWLTIMMTLVDTDIGSALEV